MKNISSILRTLAVSALIPSAAFTCAAEDLTRIRGEIAAVSPTSLTVNGRDGDTVKIAITPGQVVNALKRIKLADIEKNSFIGTATKPAPDGKLIALEVVVFPEAERGDAEGHYAWDLLPGSSMTNANVDGVANGVKGRTLKLSYKGGTQEVLVPKDAPVLAFAPATGADLVPGKKIFVLANGGVTDLKSIRIFVEKNGVAPPM